MEGRRLIIETEDAGNGSRGVSYQTVSRIGGLKDGVRPNGGGHRGWFTKEFTTVLKSTLGSGFFALPFALKQAGLVGGVLLVISLALLTSYTTKQLIYGASRVARSKRYSEEIGYIEVWEAAFSGYVFVISFCIFAAQYTACCAYLVFLQTTLTPLVMETFYGVERYSELADFFVLLVMTLIQFGLAMAPNPSFLGKTAVFGNISFLISVIFILGSGFLDSPPSFSRTKLFGDTGFQGFFIAFGITSFTLSAHAESIAIFSTSPPQAQIGFDKVVDRSLFVATICYLVIAVFAYACYGDDTAQVILQDFKETLFGDVLQVSVCIMIICSYPLTMFPVHQMLERNWPKDDDVDNDTLSQYQITSRFVFIFTTAYIAYISGENFGMVSAIGGSCIGLLGFCIPPLVYIQLCGGWSELTWFQVIVNLLAIIFGLVGSVQSLIDGFEALIHVPKS